MDRTRFATVPGTQLGTRFLWLVAVPAGSCLTSWGLLFLGPRVPPAVGIAMAAFPPLLGLIGVLAYRWLTGDHVRLWPYAPFAVAVAVYVPTMLDLAVAVAREPDGAFIPVVPIGVGFLLPFIAFGCGLVSFLAVEPRTR